MTTDVTDAGVGTIRTGRLGSRSCSLSDGLPAFADGLRAAVFTDAVLEAAQSRTRIEVTA
ncbi:hypothetical protein K0817_007260 [Microbacterium sp. HD4P20]|uniref:hypothetical protein n=1 Tax=Microbacterium sp. HD4P20 TaxID=2864874 RepID=UPI001C642570|nr:hypothetical protein [Microbacterium sp. HD4P20]MCP2636366.1 hypothetical protein [Microbacterium sp. HD4P20]